MGKLIMWNVITLDGYFEGNQNWDLSFHNLVWGQELEKLSIEQLNSADYLVFGRVTYEGMAAYWTKAEGEATEQEVAKLMNSIPKIVFSKTLKSADWNNTTIINENASDEIIKLKEQGGKDIYVFGSANLSETFINDNLFDEYRIGIAPVILGNGRPLFRQGIKSNNLSLVSTQQLLTGGVVLKYSKNKIDNLYSDTNND
jgi:dihydrofolate reductase